MHSVLTGRDIEGAFDHPAFAPLKATGSACFIAGGQGPDLVWANGAALGFFGVRSVEDLGTLLFGDRGVASRVVGLAKGLPPGAAPRLARLLVPRGPTAHHSTVLYDARHDDDDRLVAVAVLGSGSAKGRAKTPGTGGQPPWMASPFRPPAEPAAVPEAPVKPVLAEPLAMPAAASPTEPHRPAGSASVDVAPVRVLWQTDAAGLLTRFDGAPLRGSGASAAPAPPEALVDAIAAFDPDGAERLRQRLATRATWAGVEVRWPIADGTAVMPAAFSAVPVLDADRRFSGFRGFGLFKPARAEAASPRAETPVVADAPRAAAGGADARSGPDKAGESPGADEIASHAATADHASTTDAGSDATAGAPDAIETASDGVAPPLVSAAPAESPAAAPSTNVVPLRPAHALQPGRGLIVAEAEPVPPAPDAAPPFDDDHVADPGPGTPAGALSSSEHRAFQEIARALTSNVDAVADVGRTDAGRPDGSAPRSFEDADRVEERDGTVRRLEADLRRMTREAGEFRAMLEGSGDTVAVLDEDGRIHALNTWGDIRFGRDRAEPIGEDFTRLLAPESRPDAAAAFTGVKEQPPGTTRFPRLDVLVRRSEARPVPMRLTLGRLGAHALFAAFRDVPAAPPARGGADLAPAPADWSAGQKAGFLARISHEIRTPLNAILGFAELMIGERFGALGNARYKDYLKDIHASGTRVLTLVNNLVDLSRIEAGNHDLDFGAVDINKVIGDCVAQTQAQAHRERVVMRMSLGSRLPPILADERSVHQIVSNILSNAVKFNEPGGQVIVSTTLGEGGRVAVRVRDTGIGMSENELATALEPFRDAAPAKVDGGGAKLGLPLAKALIGANGAALSIRSRPNEGTLVEVVFTPALVAAAGVPA